MLLNGKTISQITEADLQLLVDEERIEDLRLDFKRDCYDFTDNDSKANKRKEFCKDVAALANASGGWIICGVADTQGKASQVLGIENLNIDTRKRQFVDWMDNDIEPKLYGVVMEPVSLATGNTVLIIEVPRSFAGPHRIKTNEFPLRRDGKIDPNMSINDLRRAFVGNANYADQIRDFRRKRVEAILDFNHPDSFTPLEEGPLLAVHVMPMGMIEEPFRISFDSLEFATKALFRTDYGHTFAENAKFNLDGIFMPDRRSSKEIPREYIHVFRSGATEYVETDPYLLREEPRTSISLHTLKTRVLLGMAYCLRLMQSVGINEPCYVTVTTARTIGFSWTPYSRGYRLNDHPPIKYDPLYLPEQYVTSWEQELNVIMKPTFDVWANAIGWAKSKSYDLQGVWFEHEGNLAIPPHDMNKDN